MRRLCKTLFHHGWLRSSTFLPLPSSSSWLYFTLNLVRGHTLPYHKMYQVNGSAHLQQRNNLANSFKNVQLTATTFEKNLEKDDFTGTNITIKAKTWQKTVSLFSRADVESRWRRQHLVEETRSTVDLLMKR